MEVREGLLDVLPEGYGFLRVSGYGPGEQDVYVSAGLVRRMQLRKGDLVGGPIRPPPLTREIPGYGESGARQQSRPRRGDAPTEVRKN